LTTNIYGLNRDIDKR